MKSIGCLTVIALIALGIFLLGKGQDMSQDEQGRYIGEKVHRGYNKIKQVVTGAKEGWKTVPDEEQEDDDQPETQPGK
jgi:hypothetical protein